MIEANQIYKLLHSVKGWPVEDASTLEEASANIFGSPYWNIPEDCYLVIETNATYCLLGVFQNGKVRPDCRYLTVSTHFDGHVELSGVDCHIE